MSTPRTLLVTAALTASALAPVTALAATATTTPRLKSSPQMRVVDAHHAKLNFASERLSRTAAGKINATITFAGGERVSGLKANGKHGRDTKYIATVSSTKVMSHHDKFAVTFRLGKSKPVKRIVTLFKAGAHS